LIQRLVKLGKQAQLVLSEIEWIIVKPDEYQNALLVDQVDRRGEFALTWMTERSVKEPRSEWEGKS